jgi:hypothetical protein
LLDVDRTYLSVEGVPLASLRAHDVVPKLVENGYYLPGCFVRPLAMRAGRAVERDSRGSLLIQGLIGLVRHPSSMRLRANGRQAGGGSDSMGTCAQRTHLARLRAAPAAVAKRVRTPLVIRQRIRNAEPAVLILAAIPWQLTASVVRSAPPASMTEHLLLVAPSPVRVGCRKSIRDVRRVTAKAAQLCQDLRRSHGLGRTPIRPVRRTDRHLVPIAEYEDANGHLPFLSPMIGTTLVGSPALAHGGSRANPRPRLRFPRRRVRRPCPPTSDRLRRVIRDTGQAVEVPLNGQAGIDWISARLKPLCSSRSPDMGEG